MKLEENKDIETLDIPEYMISRNMSKIKQQLYITNHWLDLFNVAAFSHWFHCFMGFEGHLIYDYVWVDHLSEVKTLLHLALMIGISALILILWASYNWIGLVVRTDVLRHLIVL